MPLMEEPLSVSVSRAQEGGLIVTLRYTYQGSPPPLRKRAGMAKALLGEALDRLEEGTPVDLGFAEDAARRVRTDKLEA
jgi:hypothetical protein